MARAGRRERSILRARFRSVLDRKSLFPILPIAVLNQDGDGRADGFPMPHAGKKLGRVGFDFHPPAASVAALAALELAVEVVKIQTQPGGQALKDRHQCLAVRLA